MFLATWKDIPNENEAQFQIRDCPLTAGRIPGPVPAGAALCPDPSPEHWTPTSDLVPPEAVSSRLQSSHIFTVARRNVEGQDMLYQSLKLTNGIWVLAELRIQPGNPNFTVRRPLPPAALRPLPSCPHACLGWGQPWWGRGGHPAQLSLV